MGKDGSVMKSLRVPEELFNEANGIFRREGFSFSEAVRLLLEATVREERVPRGLVTKNTEELSDKAAHREAYVDSILNTVLPNPDYKGLSAEEQLLQQIFGEPEEAKDMSNARLREWGDKWGLPDNLSVATLADLHDSGLFGDDPWFGDYDYQVEENDDENVIVLMKFRDNIRDNLEKVSKKLLCKAIKTLMEYDIKEDQNNG